VQVSANTAHQGDPVRVVGMQGPQDSNPNHVQVSANTAHQGDPVRVVGMHDPQDFHPNHVQVSAHTAHQGDPVRVVGMQGPQDSLPNHVQVSANTAHQGDPHRRVIITKSKQESHPSDLKVSATTKRDVKEEHPLSRFNVVQTSNKEHVLVSTAVHCATNLELTNHSSTEPSKYDRIVLSGSSGQNSRVVHSNDRAIDQRAGTLRGGVSVNPVLTQENRDLGVVEVSTGDLKRSVLLSRTDGRVASAYITNRNISQPSCDSSVRNVKTIQCQTDALLKSKPIQQYQTASDMHTMNMSRNVAVHEREHVQLTRSVLNKTPVLAQKRKSIQFKSKGVVNKPTKPDQVRC
jgi:hypothetical protein